MVGDAAKAVDVRLMAMSSIKTREMIALLVFFISPPPLLKSQSFVRIDRNGPNGLYRIFRLALDGGSQDLNVQRVLRICRVCNLTVQQAVLCGTVGLDGVLIIVTTRAIHPLIGQSFRQIVAVPIRDGGDDVAILIHPVYNAGGADVRVLENHWTVVTSDGSLSAHYENTVAIGENGPELLTYIR